MVRPYISAFMYYLPDLRYRNRCGLKRADRSGRAGEAHQRNEGAGSSRRSPRRTLRRLKGRGLLVVSRGPRPLFLPSGRRCAMLNAEVPLVMPDQFLSTVAAAVAGKAAELAVQGGKGACAALVRL